MSIFTILSKCEFDLLYADILKGILSRKDGREDSTRYCVCKLVTSTQKAAKAFSLIESDRPEKSGPVASISYIGQLDAQ